MFYPANPSTTALGRLDRHSGGSAREEGCEAQKGQVPAVESPAAAPDDHQQATEKSTKKDNKREKANKGKNVDKAGKTHKEQKEQKNQKKSGGALPASSSQPARELAEPDAPDRAVIDATTENLVVTVEAARHLANPTDLLSRLATILLDVAVRPSMERGLLGDLSSLISAGDGSALPTYSNGHGKKTCQHGRREPCDCPRVYSDPDAQRPHLVGQGVRAPLEATLRLDLPRPRICGRNRGTGDVRLGET
jgi:hypothetical protein